MKVLLKAPLSTYSGYGNDGIGLAQALIRWGADVYLQPTHVDAPLPKDVAELLTKEVKAPFDLFINHVDPMILEAKEHVTDLAEVSVGWTMWEYSNLSNMAKKPLKTLRKRLKHFDALVGYSDIDRGCFEPYFDGPIIVQQGGFDPTQWPEISRDYTDETFYFCMVGMLSERKDPFRSIRAFVELQREHEDFKEHARLSLKTGAPGLHSRIEDAYPGIRVFYDTWPVEILRDFYAAQHVLLAPSRGEGKNMPALEFMSTGGVVIATNWAGHTQWLDPSYSYPLDYTLERAYLYEGDQDNLNARADVEHLKELMLRVFRNRHEAQEKGHLAAQIIPQTHSWDRVVEKLLEKIRETIPEKGERLWLKSQMARTGGSRA